MAAAPDLNYPWADVCTVQTHREPSPWTSAAGGRSGLRSVCSRSSPAGLRPWRTPLDAGLAGAWTASQPDCAKLFVRRGGALAYRQPVDKFAQAAIIGPQVILLPATSCHVERVAHASGVIKITADCNDSISYTTQTVEIKVKSTGEIVYSPTGDPALDTTLIKCPI